MNRLRSSLAEVGVTLAIALFLWREVPTLRSMPDEQDYVDAGALIRQGHSPYESRAYLYPPLTAEVFARLGTNEEPRRGLPIVRTFNIISAALLAWLCVCHLGPHAMGRVICAALILALPPVADSVSYFGNLTPASIAPCLAALLLWPVAPVFAGLLLGFGLAIKPMLIGAVVLLPLHRAESGNRRHLLCSAVAGITFAALAFNSPYVLDFLLQKQEARNELGALGSSSIHCALLVLGLHLSARVVALGVLGAALAFARIRVLTPRSLLILVFASSLLALPRVWLHTYCLALPLLVFSAENGARRMRDARLKPEKARALLGLLAVAFAAILLSRSQVWSGGWGYPQGLPRTLLALTTLIPPAAALFLACSALEESSPQHQGATP